MLDNGLGSWPVRRARSDSAHVAIRFADTVLTYGALLDRVRRTAWALRAVGVRRGDRVAWLGNNHPESVELLFAAGMLGAIFVPMNMRLAVDEVVYQLTDCAATVFLHDDATAAVAAGDRAATGQVWSLPQLARRRADAASDPIDEPVELSDPALIMYTSGTTGQAKGVVLTHGNLTFNAMNVLIELDLATDEIALITTPLFHAAALNMNALPVLLKGGTLVIEQSAKPAELLSLMAEHRVTHVQSVPTIHQALVSSPMWSRTDLSRLRRVVSGGAAASAGLIRAFTNAGVIFCQGYGMTETSPGALFLPPQSSSRKPGSVGRPMFFTDVIVADPDGRPVPAGQTGEVLVSGPNVMSGYWNRPEATAAALQTGGWYHSGDIARFDDDGDGYIVGRIKDMYVSGGENVYPAEVEAVLDAHPAIAESAVIAVPDPRWGEVGRAVVVLRAGFDLDEREVLDHARAHLAHYKAPKSAVFLDVLPRNAAGKTIKQELRERCGAADLTAHPVGRP